MDNNRSESLLQNDAVVTFIVAATRYCALVEPLSTPEWTEETMRDCRVILADLYSAALHLPELQSSVNYTSGDPERVVTEESYASVRRRLERFFGIEDRFLDAQQESQRYSDLPVSASASELMADIYQAVADPIWDIRQNGASTLVGTLASIEYTFEYEWGKSILLVLKHLHDLAVNPRFEPATGLSADEDEEKPEGYYL